jgi:hypothetical protein
MDDWGVRFAKAWAVVGRLLDDAHPSWREGVGPRLRGAELLAFAGGEEWCVERLRRIFAQPK